MDHIQQTYTKMQRIKKISPILSDKKNIMMISDFINYNGGGVETHIHDITEILSHDGYHITLYGHHAPTGKRASLQKIVIMLSSLINIRDSYHIIKKIKKNSI